MRKLVCILSVLLMLITLAAYTAQEPAEQDVLASATTATAEGESTSETEYTPETVPVAASSKTEPVTTPQVIAATTLPESTKATTTSKKTTTTSAYKKPYSISALEALPGVGKNPGMNHLDGDVQSAYELLGDALAIGDLLDARTLLQYMGDVAEAQGGEEKFVKWCRAAALELSGFTEQSPGFPGGLDDDGPGDEW